MGCKSCVMRDLSEGRNTVAPQALIHPYQAFIVPIDVAHRDRIVAEELPPGFWDEFVHLATEVYDLANPSSQGFAFTDENLSVYKLPSRASDADRPNMGLVFECLACLDEQGEELAEYSAHTHRPTSFAPVGGDVAVDDVSEVIDEDVEYVLGGESRRVEPDRYELHLSLALVYDQFPRHYLPISISAGVEANTREGGPPPEPPRRSGRSPSRRPESTTGSRRIAPSPSCRRR